MEKPPAKTAVITGSTRGIGREIALQLARSGYAVVIHGFQSATEAQALEEEIKQLGADAKALLADLRDPAAVEQFISAAFAWKGCVDTWVNNAGFDVLTGEASKLDFHAKLQELWETDVLGTIRCGRAAGQRMLEAERGAIINVGWDQAWQGMEGDSGEMFATTKGAIMAFTKSLAKSLAPHVRVNCVAPGWIKTSWGAEQASDYWQQRAVKESLRQRWGTPQDVASAVCFLASDEADFITGQILPVNGGFRTTD